MSALHGEIALLALVGVTVAAVGSLLASIARDSDGWVIARGVFRGRCEQLIRVLGRAVRTFRPVLPPRRLCLVRQAAAVIWPRVGGRTPKVAERHGASLGARSTTPLSAKRASYVADRGAAPCFPVGDQWVLEFDDRRGDEESC